MLARRPAPALAVARSVALGIALALALADVACTDASSATSADAPADARSSVVVAPPPRPPAPPGSAAPAPSLHTRIDGQGFPDKVIALTWDDGPDASTLELAAYLKRHRISATFFVVSSWVEGLSDDPGEGRGVFGSGYAFLPILGDLVGLGHRVANHTLNHVVLRESVGARTVDRELRENQQNLDPFLTNELRLFRAPGGGWGPFAAAIVDGDPYLSRMVGPIAWDVDRKDWDESLHCRGPRGAFECERAAPGGALRMKPSVVAARYVASIESARHGIVLLHDRVGHVGSSYGLDVAQAMIPQLEARGFVFAAPVLRFSPPLVRHHEADVSDAHRWEPSTVRLGDVDGDGRQDLCGKSVLGVSCALSVQTASMHDASMPDDRLPRTAFAFAGRVHRAAQATAAPLLRSAPDGTLHLADVTGDGQADLCIARAGGIACAASNVRGELGELRSWSSGVEPLEHVEHVEHVGHVVAFGDVDGDGKADTCSRGPGGITCAKSLGDRFDAPRMWLADASTAHGAADARDASSDIQLVDVDGDGRADVCGRAPSGVVCALSNGRGFGKMERWSAASDFAEGAVVFGDLNGDGRADVCSSGAAANGNGNADGNADGNAGVACALATVHGFTRASIWLDAAGVRAQGWNRAELAATLQLGDVNGDGRADLCGRADGGVACALAP